MQTFFSPKTSDDECFDPNDDREPDKYISEVKVKPQIQRNMEVVSFDKHSRKSSNVGETGSSQVYPKSVKSQQNKTIE